MFHFNDELNKYVKRDFRAYVQDLDPLTISQYLHNLNVGPIFGLVENWGRLYDTVQIFSGKYHTVFSELRELWLGPTASAALEEFSAYADWLQKMPYIASEARWVARRSIDYFREAPSKSVRPDLIKENRAKVARLREEITRVPTSTGTLLTLTHIEEISKLEREYDEYQAQNVKAMLFFADCLELTFQRLKPFIPLHSPITRVKRAAPTAGG